MYLFVVLLFYKQENKYGYKKRVKRGYFRGKCTFFEKKLRNVLLVSEKFIPLHSQKRQ